MQSTEDPTFTYYGFLAAFISCLSFGTFAVPMKGEAATSVDIDPLVFQSYKVFWCFATSFLVLLAGEKVQFTPWGIVSAAFWVPAGMSHVCGVRTAGLAIAQATLASLIVLVSFSWGIFFFKERVKNLASACSAVLLIVGGIWGMSHYSSPTSKTGNDIVETEMVELKKQNSDTTISPSNSTDSDDSLLINDIENKNQIVNQKIIHGHKTGFEADVIWFSKYINKKYNIHTTPRLIGISCSGFGGVWGGTQMVPLQYSSEETQGLGFIISFAIGAVIWTCILWFIRYMYYYNKLKSATEAYYALPSFHVKTMYFAGSISGLLWSLGNICSIISVTYLGEGIGFSVTQGSMLISGLWGIFHFKEITQAHDIRMWIVMAIITITGILLLSYNHVDAV